MNRQFTTDLGCSGAFMTLFYLAIDHPSKTIRWFRASHDPAICYDPVSERFEEFGGQGVPLGVDETATFEESEKKELRPGEIIFIGTDGIWETTAPDGQLFGKKNLYDLIQTCSDRSAGEITQEVLKALEAFRQGHKPSDDITMVVIKIL